MLEWVDESISLGAKSMTQNQKTWIKIALLYLFIIVIFTLHTCLANAQTWDWSPPAPHHAAVCRVQSGDRGGSGVFIKYRGIRGVLTAAHLMTNAKTTVQFSDGTKSATDHYTVDKFGHDVAFVFADNSAITPVAISNIDPQPGDRVELVTTGGPENRLRRFWATVKFVGKRTTKYDCDVVSGDSGGGILNLQTELVGIQSFGDPPDLLTAWNGAAYRGAGSASCKPIRDFLDRVAKCGLKGCPRGANPKKGPEYYPPAPLIPVKKPGRPVPPDPSEDDSALSTPPGFSINYDKLVVKILAKIDPDDFRGPAGPQGTAGRDGAVGKDGPAGQSDTAIDIDDLVKQIKKRIQGSIRVKVRPIPPK